MTVRGVAVTLVGFLALVGVAHPASAQARIVQVVLRGGSNAILGDYYQIGLGFRFAGGTLLLGGTYTDVLQLEPYLAFTRPWSLPAGWTLTFLASSGDLGGDYRVNRLPEVTLSRRVSLSGPLVFALDLSAGYYVVRPNNLTGARVTAVPQVRATFPLGRTAAITGTLGYRHHGYFAATSNAQWWGTVVLALTPSPDCSVTFTYLYQDAWGSSPLLFDGLGDDHTLAGVVRLRVSPALTLQHSQTYSYISRTISARVYTATLTTPQGLSLSVSYDDVPQTLTFSLSFSVLSLSFSR